MSRITRTWTLRKTKRGVAVMAYTHPLHRAPCHWWQPKIHLSVQCRKFIGGIVPFRPGGAHGSSPRLHSPPAHGHGLPPPSHYPMSPLRCFATVLVITHVVMGVKGVHTVDGLHLVGLECSYKRTSPSETAPLQTGQPVGSMWCRSRHIPEP